MPLHRKHILVIVSLIVCVTAMNSQWVLDRCLYSTPTSYDFSNSENIANANGADIVKFINGSWTGMNTNIANNITIAPPIDCDQSKAVFLRVTSQDSIGQGVGFKLSEPLELGQTFSLEFTYASHGFGAQATFQPYIYTHNSSNFQFDGQINANYLTTLPSVGSQWESNALSFVVNSTNAGDDWIYFYAPTSSGILFNLCQIDHGNIEFQPAESFELCDGETIEIGEELGENVYYSWNSGQNSSIIEVNSLGIYVLQAQNSCNSIEISYSVAINYPPYIIPDVEEITLCEGDSLELTTFGLNPEAQWPDNSNNDLFYIFDEGVYDVIISDDCFTITDQIIVQYDTIPSVDLGPDLALCEGDTYLLDATSTENEVTYEWQNNSTEPSYTVHWQSTFSVTLSNYCGSAYDEVFIEYSINPQDIFEEDTLYICSAREVLLDVSEIEGEYLWQDGSTDAILDGQFWGLYWVQIIDDDGCFYLRDSVYVKEGNCVCPLFIPNAFTPDNDGLNDILRCEFECLPYDFVMEIYSRWGTVVHRSYDPTNCWEGTFVGGDLVPIGTYNYRIWYREEYDGIPIERMGHVTVLSDKWEGEQSVIPIGQ